MPRRLSALLNSCESGNLLAEDQKELSSLITEYFTADNCHDEGWSDDDSDSEVEHDEVADETSDHSDTEIDKPIVTVDVVRGEAEVRPECDMTVDNVPNAMLARAQQRCCKANGYGCKQIKVPAPA